MENFRLVKSFDVVPFNIEFDYLSCLVTGKGKRVILRDTETLHNSAHRSHANINGVQFWGGNKDLPYAKMEVTTSHKSIMLTVEPFDTIRKVT